MSSPVAELEAGLQAMLGLKPPGVSGSRITGITTLCVNNVQSESVLIQKLYTHFKKAPGTHKLGVLYVVDSVTRKWMEQAKAQGQPISSTAQDGTYAAGVHRVTELMPVLMNDIISSCPEDQKEKIKKLVDIWEKGQTFPQSLLASFREKLSAPPTSTTPPGSPPASNMASAQGSHPAGGAPANMPSIMEALANIARQNATTAQGNPSVPAPVPAVPAAAPAYSLPGAFSNIAAPAQSVTPQQPGLPFLPGAQPGATPVNMPQMPQMPQMPYQFPPQQPPQQQAAALATALGMAGGFPANPAAAPAMPNASLDPKVQQQLVLIQTLAAQGIPFDKITSIIALMGNQPAAPAVAPPSVPPAQQMPQPTSSYAAPWEPPRHDESRDSRNGYRDPVRSPKPRGRSRSRSPARGWDARDAPPNRDRGYNNYGHDSSQNGRGGRGGHDDRGRDSYRQRSPARGRGFTPEEELEPQDKWVEYDTSLANGHIKVFSRTLFVGGVTCSEAELRQIFSRYGKVQTCIVNKDKRHAFVKMYWRKDAVRAKEAMEHNRDHDLPLRTRWGVGFGPRDCSDYQTGVSIIPIHKLTDADRKWMLTAPFGGSGGRPIVTGLCVEEPDIEIGAGVSSKAISRRMQTDKSGNQGPRSTKEHDEQIPPPQQARGGMMGGAGDRGGRERWRGRGDGRRDTGRREERMNEDNRDRHRGGAGGNNAGADEPVVMGFPPGITMGPNGINFPPGFAFGQGGGNGM